MGDPLSPIAKKLTDWFKIQRTNAVSGSEDTGMADRKQFFTMAKNDAELDALLEATKDVVPSEDELHEQRVSFAFGNAPDSDYLTHDTVVEASKSIRLSK